MKRSNRSETQPIRAVLIGAGNRGMDVYGTYALHHPEQIQFVAVAEPNPERRARFASQHHIPTENQFPSWEPMLERSPLGEAAFICTLDQQHTAPALAALRAGYHVLLEKPMALTASECRQIVQTSKEMGQQLHIGHVLRYTPHFQTMRQVIQSGQLGQIITVDHRENVAWYHMAHSFVRGNWRNRAGSRSMILAKCCHDFDILVWMLDRRCQRLSSTGALTHFRPENGPPDAPRYCLDGCPISESCPYYAPFIYLDMLPIWRAISEQATGLPKWAALAQQRAPGLVKALSRVIPPLRQVSNYRGWPRSIVAGDPTPENLLAALREGPYGRCVYHCDNDVVDHQVVAMQFEGDISVTLTMQGHAHLEGRSTRIQGSQAELQAFFGLGGAWIEINEHRSDQRTRIDTSTPVARGHGGGDTGLVTAFVHHLRHPEALPPDAARIPLESHWMAFAADQARLERSVVEIDTFRF